MIEFAEAAYLLICLAFLEISLVTETFGIAIENKHKSEKTIFRDETDYDFKKEEAFQLVFTMLF